jgi:glycosyltransferase involved in cell wall biosynthesis
MLKDERSAIVAPAPARTLRVLFVGKAPLSHVGGAEMSTRHLATALAARGHDVAVLTSIKKRSAQGVVDLGVSVLGGRALEHIDSRHGFPWTSSVRPLRTLQSMARALSPEVVVVTGTDPSFALSALQQTSNRPSVLYPRVAAAWPVALAPHVDLVVTNSEFMADGIRQLGAEATFLPSVFPPAAYKMTPVRERVLFVNPVPKKGVEIALYLAERRPDIPFVFSLAWRIEPGVLRQLRRRARTLGNVEIRKPTHDPATLYRDCRILLVPSQWEEPWPRVASEAQISGIPAIASHVGGLPEAVGPGGILVAPPDSRQAWLDALSTAWDDQKRYEELSSSALEHSRRPEMNPDLVVQRFEGLLAQAIERHRECVAEVV